MVKLDSWANMSLIVWRPDGTRCKGTLEDWKEFARDLAERLENQREITELERQMRMKQAKVVFYEGRCVKNAYGPLEGVEE